MLRLYWNLSFLLCRLQTSSRQLGESSHLCKHRAKISNMSNTPGRRPWSPSTTLQPQSQPWDLTPYHAYHSWWMPLEFQLPRAFVQQCTSLAPSVRHNACVTLTYCIQIACVFTLEWYFMETIHHNHVGNPSSCLGTFEGFFFIATVNKYTMNTIIAHFLSGHLCMDHIHTYAHTCIHILLTVPMLF